MPSWQRCLRRSQQRPGDLATLWLGAKDIFWFSWCWKQVRYQNLCFFHGCISYIRKSANNTNTVFGWNCPSWDVPNSSEVVFGDTAHMQLDDWMVTKKHHTKQSISVALLEGDGLNSGHCALYCLFYLHVNLAYPRKRERHGDELSRKKRKVTANTHICRWEVPNKNILVVWLHVRPCWLRVFQWFLCWHRFVETSLERSGLVFKQRHTEGILSILSNLVSPFRWWIRTIKGIESEVWRQLRRTHWMHSPRWQTWVVVWRSQWGSVHWMEHPWWHSRRPPSERRRVFWMERFCMNHQNSLYHPMLGLPFGVCLKAA